MRLYKTFLVANPLRSTLIQKDEEKKIPSSNFFLNEGIDVLKKSLIFLEQQDNVDFKTEDYSRQPSYQSNYIPLLRQTSIYNKLVTTVSLLG